MIVLQETASEQTFSFIPRTEVYDSMFLRDDQNNTEVEVTITSSTQGDYYHTISACLLYTSPSPRDATLSRMPSSA